MGSYKDVSSPKWMLSRGARNSLLPSAPAILVGEKGGRRGTGKQRVSLRNLQGVEPPGWPPRQHCHPSGRETWVPEDSGHEGRGSQRTLPDA